MSEPIVKVKDLSHSYGGDWAIRDINFEISDKGVLGLLGSNGAGKSTTMNIVCGVLNQTEGNVYIDGFNLRENPEEAKKRIGFLPQNPPLYLDLTVDEYLTHCAHLRLIAAGQIPAAVQAAKERCGVAHFSKRLISNLSGGYRQRVGIAQAIIHKPRIVVLDEPTNGLDPNQIYEVRNLIREIAGERSVIFSSHILSEVQATCQSVKMIEQGRVVFSDTMDAFNNYITPSSMLAAFENAPGIEDLVTIPGIRRATAAEGKRVRLHFDPGVTSVTERIIETSVARGWRLTEITLERSSLDEIFAKLSNKEKRTVL
jgi:ABC-2 type transport system ATP-binding protein